MALHSVIAEVTDQIIKRSHPTRHAYLALMAQQAAHHAPRQAMSCANLAHTLVTVDGEAQKTFQKQSVGHLGVITAYNDMLSAHKPYERYPDLIRALATQYGGSAQVAGGIPAMCDGITQGQPGMDLSLFSRDVIAQATVIGLSHNVFDGVIGLGICDKIVPGFLMGALSMGHLPTMMIPSGPMSSGLSNAEKSKTRQAFAAGEIDQQALLEAEMQCYHSTGTCTFYGTANTNQVLAECVGLHLPDASFVPPDSPLRDALTRAAVGRMVKGIGDQSISPICEILDEKAMVNGIIGLLATGGSTNHTMHWIAIGKACGIQLNWDDFDKLGRVIPLLAQVYPNGSADVNAFHQAGGVAYVISELLGHGLMHNDVKTILGEGLDAYATRATLDADQLIWNDIGDSTNLDVLSCVEHPFRAEGGLRLVAGNLGRAMVKTSAITEEDRVLEAPARIFHHQNEFFQAFEQGELNEDMIVVIRFQGPRATGMPEMHRLIPSLKVLKEKGLKVALVTDGRMSGASGSILCAIHATPEAACQGGLAKLREGDLLRIDAQQGTLEALVSESQWEQRIPVSPAYDVVDQQSIGRGLFASAREGVSGAEAGASFLSLYDLD